MDSKKKNLRRGYFCIIDVTISEVIAHCTVGFGAVLIGKSSGT
jgi:hypothetical protein